MHRTTEKEHSRGHSIPIGTTEGVPKNGFIDDLPRVVISEALTGGYDLGFIVAAGCVASAIVVALTVLRAGPQRAPTAAAEPSVADSLDAV